MCVCVCAQIDFITGVSGNGQPQPETIGFLITNRANTFPMFDDFGVFKLRTTLFHMISFSSNSPTLISESQVACCIAIAHWKVRWSRNEASTIRLEFFSIWNPSICFLVFAVKFSGNSRWVPRWSCGFFSSMAMSQVLPRNPRKSRRIANWRALLGAQPFSGGLIQWLVERVDYLCYQ